jgi:HCOMODA/2-hydroxy-3-carboxy-muconic semialdehyde decarboxylase
MLRSNYFIFRPSADALLEQDARLALAPAGSVLKHSMNKRENELDACVDLLVTANHILATERVVDALGHVSVRHPERADRFLMACSRPPGHVSRDDIMEFDLDCRPIDQRGRSMYAERPIHGALYQSRADVGAVVHNHAHDVLPFTVSALPLRPLIHVGAVIGGPVPVWDIADAFGETDLLVRTMDQGEDLAKKVGSGTCALMRGHGCVVVGTTLQQAVLRAIYLMINARLQIASLPLGNLQYLSEREIALSAEAMDSQLALERIWAYYANRISKGDRTGLDELS